MKNNKYKVTAATLYLGTFLMQGVSLSILAQYKAQFASLWNCDIASVLSLISVNNLGALIFTLLVGPISDRFGRKIPAIIGNLFQGCYYFSLISAPSLAVEKILAFIFYGLGNSFAYVTGNATILEIFPKRASSANVMIKFLISVGQFLLPWFILWASLTHTNFKVVFIGAGLIYVLVSIILGCSKFPPYKTKDTENTRGHKFNIKSLKLDASVLALIFIGYTSVAEFNLWTNTYQELAKVYGISQPSIIESIYAVGGAISVLLTSYLVAGRVKESTILTYYPFLAGIAVMLEVLIPHAWIMYPAAFLFGLFAAGGLFQLCTALLAKKIPKYKATAISLAQFMSLVGNTSIIFFASLFVRHFGNTGYTMIVWLNVVVCIIGGLLGLVVKVKDKN